MSSKVELKAAPNAATVIDIKKISNVRINTVEGYLGDDDERGFNVEVMVTLETGGIVFLNLCADAPEKLRIENDRNLDAEAEVAQWLGTPLPSAAEVAQALADHIERGSPVDDTPFDVEPTKH